VRRVLAATALGAAILAGWAQNNGLTQTRPDARPYADAHAECWTVAMNNAGQAATARQLQVYNTCMANNGWADKRSF
jgi:hypothetical protein